MVSNNRPLLLEEASNCRRQAIAYAGKPEASFLLRAADTFEELAAAAARRGGSPLPRW